MIRKKKGRQAKCVNASFSVEGSRPSVRGETMLFVRMYGSCGKETKYFEVTANGEEDTNKVTVV